MTAQPELKDPFTYRDRLTGQPTWEDGTPLTNEEIKRRIQARDEAYLLAMDRHHGVIKSLRELEGFTVVELTRYKPGVVRYRAMKGENEMRMGFAKDYVFAGAQLP